MARRLHTLILAGGSGTRFWPLSRELSPKQLLSVFGEDSLLISTIERAQSVMDDEGLTYILMSADLSDEIKNHILASKIDTSRIRYIIEPSARNTAPALAYGAAVIERDDPNSILMMLPSDHVCEADEEWQKTIAAAVIRAHGGDLVTIGLKPRRAETAYGYIRAGESILKAKEGAHNEVFRAAEFVEKPDAATAQKYVDSGDYFWNSGMLVARPDSILSQMVKVTAHNANAENALHTGQMALAARTIAEMGDEAYAIPVAQHLYAMLPSIAFDKAVLEFSTAVALVPADLQWSDVGSLDSLELLAEADERGNFLIGKVVDVDSDNILCYSAGTEFQPARLIATLGLDNVMVIDTPDATLVADRSRSQDVKQIVSELQELGAPELVNPRTSLRPWGSWTVLVKSKGFQVKEVDVLPHTRLSLQSHDQRAEHWIVIEGEAFVTRGGDELTLRANESIFIPIGVKHRLENKSDKVLRIVEVATGAYLDEDDIVRFEDDFGR